MHMKRFIVFATTFVFLQASFLQAQDTHNDNEGELIHSMGIPSKYEFSWGPMFVINQEGDKSRFGGQVYAGLSRYLASPILGLGITGEGYVEIIEGENVDGGMRLLGMAQPFYLSAGVDHAFRDEKTNFILSLAFPLKRGGLFGRGGNLRIDWIPGRDNSFNIGLSFPLGKPYMGKTRAKHDQVALPEASTGRADATYKITSPELERTLENIHNAADWINRYTTPFFDQNEIDDEKELAGFLQKVRSFKEHINLKDDLYPEGHTVAAEITTYHRMLERAFTLAVGGEQPSADDRAEGLRIADKAREIVFQEVILPYNRLLGRSKKYDSLLGYGANATASLTTWLDFSTQISGTQRAAVLHVFTRLLDIMEEHRQGSKAIWKYSELEWIPLQYGLQRHQYDTRKELNAILERITEAQFNDANQIYYIINEAFQAEVARMILQAEDYHVLWIHDYRGVNAAGKPDSVSFHQTVNVYMAALTKNVRKYDATGKMPTYLILLDQYFFELTGGRFWMQFLQNPLHHTLRFPSEYRDWADHVKAAQHQLRMAVAESELLQAQAKKYGKKWLANKIKVHVNITNPSDYSFRSAHLIPYMPFAPDNLMRDHRKISFYDVTERDPGKGEALYSGMGIGEQYVGPTWDDRAVLVRGPVLVSVKNAARQVLVQQGFQEDEIPLPLRKQTTPWNYDEMVDALRERGWTASLMDLHNQTGFGPKQINLLKTSLYSLMPPGSTIIVPDAFWNTPFWGGMLAGAALRGCRVLAIVPSPENATFTDAFPLLSRSQELFSRLLMIQNELREELDAVGGMLKTGVYTREAHLGDPKAVEEFRQGIRRSPFLKEIFPFDPDVYAVLDDFEEAAQELESAGFRPTYYAEDAVKRKPKLHIKMNFFASGEVQDLLSHPRWDDILRALLHYRMKFIARDKKDYVDVKDIPEELRKAFNHTFRTYWESLSGEEQRQAMAYLTIGSQNHDYRGMIMDGEVACVVSSYHNLLALVDLFFLTGFTTWVEDLETLEEILPSYKGWKRWLGRYIMKTL